MNNTHDLHGCGLCGGGGLKCYVLQATKCSNDAQTSHSAHFIPLI